MSTTFAILGLGNGGHAFAAYLASRGQAVRAWDFDPTHVEEIRRRGTIRAQGSGLDLETAFELVSADLTEVVHGADVILVVVPALHHASIARSLAPHIQGHQLVVLNPGATGGALEFQRTLAQHGAPLPPVAETNNMLFTCRSENPGEVTIFGIKERIDFGCLPASQTEEQLARIAHVFPQFEAVENVLHTSLTNINSMVHPLPTILNAARCDVGEPFEYYIDGITPTVAALVEQLDAERRAVAAAYGADVQSLLEWYVESYELEATSLYEAVHFNPAYRGIAGPENLRTRYISEDIATGLIPLTALARAAGVATPIADSVIQLASSLTGETFDSARTLEQLGLDGHSTADIVVKVS